MKLKTVTLTKYVKRYGPVEASRRLEIPYLSINRWIEGKSKMGQIAKALLKSHGIKGV